MTLRFTTCLCDALKVSERLRGTRYVYHITPTYRSSTLECVMEAWVCWLCRNSFSFLNPNAYKSCRHPVTRCLVPFRPQWSVLPLSSACLSLFPSLAPVDAVITAKYCVQYTINKISAARLTF